MGFNVFSKNLLVFYMLNQVIFVVDLIYHLGLRYKPNPNRFNLGALTESVNFEVNFDPKKTFR